MYTEVDGVRYSGKNSVTQKGKRVWIDGMEVGVECDNEGDLLPGLFSDLDEAAAEEDRIERAAVAHAAVSLLIRLVAIGTLVVLGTELIRNCCS